MNWCFSRYRFSGKDWSALLFFCTFDAFFVSLSFMYNLCRKKRIGVLVFLTMIFVGCGACRQSLSTQWRIDDPANST